MIDFIKASGSGGSNFTLDERAQQRLAAGLRVAGPLAVPHHDGIGDGSCRCRNGQQRALRRRGLAQIVGKCRRKITRLVDASGTRSRLEIGKRLPVFGRHRRWNGDRGNGAQLRSLGNLRCSRWRLDWDRAGRFPGFDRNVGDHNHARRRTFSNDVRGHQYQGEHHRVHAQCDQHREPLSWRRRKAGHGTKRKFKVTLPVVSTAVAAAAVAAHGAPLTWPLPVPIRIVCFF